MKISKAQVRKNLKEAHKDYKKKVKQPVTVEFQEEHISVLIRALEVYQRIKLGQLQHYAQIILISLQDLHLLSYVATRHELVKRF